MYKLINGWTKAAVMEQIKKYNNGTQARDKKHTVCKYKTENGNRCAIGCFIPDGHAALNHEGDVLSMLNVFPDLWDKMPFDVDGIGYFQSAHDKCFNDNQVYQSIEFFLDKEVEE